MSPLTQALAKISYWIENSNSWHAKAIREGAMQQRPQPGLERDTIELYAEEMNFRLPEEVYELYQWHDGVILLGNVANPVDFVSFERASHYVIDRKFPYFPIFIGDNLFYVVKEAGDRQTSPIYCYDGYDLDEQNFRPGKYAPSLTNLLQAVAECIEIYDGISAYYMTDDDPSQLSFIEKQRKYASLLSPIYKKYGVVGESCGIWR